MNLQRKIKFKNKIYNSLKEAERITGIQRYQIKKDCELLEITGKSLRIKCLNTGTIYNSFKDCRDHLKGVINFKSILSVLKQYKESVNGLKFEYTIEEPTIEKIIPEIKKQFWFTDGFKNIFSYEQPKGFYRGKTSKKNVQIRDNKTLIQLLLPYIKEANLIFLKRYFKICSRGYDRGKKSEKNYHIHHIIPISMGGSNHPSNLTKLTYREHYLAHYLLYKTLPNNEKANYCWITMNSFNGIKYKNSRLYEKTYLNVYTKRTASGYGKKISKTKLSKNKKLSKDEKLYISYTTKKGMEKVPYDKLAVHLNKKWYKNPNSKENGFFIEGKEPNGWILGRYINKS